MTSGWTVPGASLGAGDTIRRAWRGGHRRGQRRVLLTQAAITLVALAANTSFGGLPVLMGLLSGGRRLPCLLGLRARRCGIAPAAAGASAVSGGCRGGQIAFHRGSVGLWQDLASLDRSGPCAPSPLAVLR